MAQKRMFDRSIIETDNFLNISLSAKALYFLFGMEADDEGFVSPNRVIRLYGGEKGDIKNLIDVGLLIPFESGVVVITDWNQNNWLDSRRIKKTQYQKEKKLLVINEQNKYVLSKCLAIVKPEESSIEEKRGEQNKLVAKSDTPFSLKEEISKLEESTQRGLNILALYFEEKKPDLQNRGQFNAALKRHVKAANGLKSFTDAQILKAVDYAKKEYKDIWTLETINKILTK